METIKLNIFSIAEIWQVKSKYSFCFGFFDGLVPVLIDFWGTWDIRIIFLFFMHMIVYIARIWIRIIQSQYFWPCFIPLKGARSFHPIWNFLSRSIINLGLPIFVFLFFFLFQLSFIKLFNLIYWKWFSFRLFSFMNRKIFLFLLNCELDLWKNVTDLAIRIYILFSLLGFGRLR